MKTGIVLKRKGKQRIVTTKASKFWSCNECQSQIKKDEVYAKHELRNVVFLRTHIECLKEFSALIKE